MCEQLCGSTPRVLLPILSTTWHNIGTSLSVPLLYRLALTAADVKPGNVNNLVVPATTGMEGAQSVVFISPSAKALYAQMKRTGTIQSH